MQLSQRLSKATTFLYRYTYRHVIVDQATLKISPELIPLFSQPDRVGEGSWSMIQDRRDDPIETHKGIYTTIDISLAPRELGSAVPFGRFLGRNATYHPIGKKLVLARNTSFGIIHPLHYTEDPLDAIPLPEHFYSGGADSLRGFPDFQAGPTRRNYRVPAGRHGAADQPDRTALSADRRRYRRRSLSRHGQRFHQPVHHLVPHRSTWAFRFRLHGACRGFRRTLSHARRPGSH